MSIKAMTRAFVCASGCLWLAGCADVQDDFRRRFTDRYGPDPVMQYADVSATVARHQQIMAAFKMNDARGWYDAAEAGMNYVDEKCDNYMRDLFIINRDHGRIDGILKVLDTTSNAALGVTGASKASMAILAQSFGLAEGVNDSVLKSYLFEQVPGVVADKVKAARVAYRDQIEGGGRDDAYTPDEAFKVVRNYLELCMPQTIEGKFLDTYVKSAPVVTPPSPDLGVVTVTSAPIRPSARVARAQPVSAARRSTNFDIQLKSTQ
jgi:hypothetical protein